jgi:hypothetical protein
MWLPLYLHLFCFVSITLLLQSLAPLKAPVSNNDDVSSSIPKYKYPTHETFCGPAGIARHPLRSSATKKSGTQEQASVECLARFMHTPTLGSAVPESPPNHHRQFRPFARRSAREGIDREAQMNTALAGRGKGEGGRSLDAPAEDPPLCRGMARGRSSWSRGILKC